MKYYRATVATFILTVITVLGGIDPANAKEHTLAGEEVYNQTCVACHGANGNGTVPGAPDFSRKGGVLAKPDEVLLKNMLNGFQSSGSPIAMPAKGGNEDLTVKDLRKVLNYLRSRFHQKSFN